MDLSRLDHYTLSKSCQVLLGIANGILADGQLNKEEVRYLAAWLNHHADVAEVFPGNILAARIRTALDDGCLTVDELDHLKATLVALIGGTMQETGEVDGFPTTLPIQPDAVVRLSGMVFCFTGEFIFGTRTACSDWTQIYGGVVKSTVSQKLDYLVIGSMASQYWINTSYGRKIEHAVELQQNGAGLLIVSEEQWLAALK